MLSIRWRTALFAFVITLAVAPFQVLAQEVDPIRSRSGMVSSQQWMFEETGRIQQICLDES